MPDNEDPDAAAAGYGRPPAHTRFKPGNSFGRKKRKKAARAPDLTDEFEAVLREKISITINGEATKLTVRQALLLRLRDEALKGERWAIRLVQKVLKSLPPAEAYDPAAQIEWNRLELYTKLSMTSEDIREQLNERLGGRASHG